MLSFVIFLFCFLIFVIVFFVDVVKNLIKQLFEINVYDNILRLVNDQMLFIDLKVLFYLSSFNKLDELEEKFIIMVYLMLEWKDEFFMWDLMLFLVFCIIIL